MKLAIDLLGFEHGKAYGYEEFLMNLLTYFSSHIDDLKYETVILGCQSRQYDYIYSKFGDAFEYYQLDGRSYIKRHYYQHKLPKLLGFSKNDAILYPGNTMPLYGSCCKKLLVVHDLLFRHSEFCSKSLGFTIFRIHRYIYVPVSLKRANKIISISNFTKKEIIHFYGTESDKIETVYNYFNFDKYKNNKVLTIQPVTDPYYLMICSAAQHKNHITVLKAFELYYKKEKDAKLVVVGSLSAKADNFYQTLDNSVKGRIVFYQHISNDDIQYLYQHAKAYISASLFEGLGMPVVESLYFGIPALLSDTEIHREVSFNKALYFEPSDFKQLYNLLTQNKEVENLEDCIIERYSESNTSGKYVQILNSL